MSEKTKEYYRWMVGRCIELAARKHCSIERRIKLEKRARYIVEHVLKVRR